MSAGSVAAGGWAVAVKNILGRGFANALRLGFATAALREKRWRAGALQDAGATTMAPGLAQRLGVRQPSGALAGGAAVDFGGRAPAPTPSELMNLGNGFPG